MTGRRITVSEETHKALQAIRDLWRSGERNQAAIARTVDYPRATVNENIRRMLAAGELQEEGGEESTD